MNASVDEDEQQHDANGEHADDQQRLEVNTVLVVELGVALDDGLHFRARACAFPLRTHLGGNE